MMGRRGLTATQYGQSSLAQKSIFNNIIIKMSVSSAKYFVRRIKIYFGVNQF